MWLEQLNATEVHHIKTILHINNFGVHFASDLENVSS